MSTKKYIDEYDYVTTHPSRVAWSPLSRKAKAACNVIRGVRAIHVGQGDCTAVQAVDVSGGEFSLFYFDVGGGCGKCKRTHPDDPSHPRAFYGPVKLDTKHDPKVILSHWDKDHYFSATKQESLRALSWLVPRQKIGPRCAKLVRKCTSVACFPLRVKALRLKVADDTDLYIERAGDGLTAAQAGDKNLTGLACTLIRKQADGRDEQRIVMTADAPYQFVESLNGTATSAPQGEVIGLFAFHHGSRTHLTRATRSAVPTPSAGWYRVVFTYGLDAGNINNFGHPAQHAVDLYKGKKWIDRNNTASEWPDSTNDRDAGHDATTAADREIEFY